MDIVYDHIQEDAYSKEKQEAQENKSEQPQATLNADIQDAYKAFSSSPWGMKIGGFLGNVKKQGESTWSQAQKELAEVGEDATKGLTDLRESIIGRTRGLSLNTATAESSKDADDTQATPTKADTPRSQDVTESETVLSRLRSQAAKRIKDLQKAEDAADEALLRFGSNVRNFLKDAISVAPGDDSTPGSTILFESKDAQGKRVIHASRFDAQLHVIHTTAEGFAKDPATSEYETWAKEFDVEKKTEEISSDLAKYPELRITMEKLVPDQVSYADFWQRYYFLRHGLDTAEARRRDLMKAAAAEDEVGWDDDSDDEASKAAPPRPGSVASSTTIQPTKNNTLKPAESRKSNDEKSQADSEGSYDVVGARSGVPSQAPNSPKESRKGDDSDDDWE